MFVETAEITRGIRIVAKGSKTLTAQATIGSILKVGNSDPGTGYVFQAWTGAALVTSNTDTAVINLLTGEAIADVGAPNISDFTEKDWEGMPIQAASGVRALVIENESGTPVRTLGVNVGGQVIKIPKGGGLVMDAGEGNLLPTDWNTIGFYAVDEATQCWARITVLSVLGD